MFFELTAFFNLNRSQNTKNWQMQFVKVNLPLKLLTFAFYLGVLLQIGKKESPYTFQRKRRSIGKMLFEVHDKKPSHRLVFALANTLLDMQK